MLSIVKKES